MDITRKMAQTIIETAIAKGRELGFQPLSVIVLDAGGHPKAFSRDDGASPGRYKIAFGKAHGSIMLGIGGRAQMARADSQAYFVLAANGAYDGGLIPVPGGVLVRDAEGGVIGAVGVTGDTAENDVICALAGIEAVGFAAEP